MVLYYNITMVKNSTILFCVQIRKNSNFIRLSFNLKVNCFIKIINKMNKETTKFFKFYFINTSTVKLMCIKENICEFKILFIIFSYNYDHHYTIN